MAGSDLPDSKPESRRRGVGRSVFIQGVFVTLLVLIVNYVGFNYYWRADWSRSQKFRLAPQTRQAINQLKQPLRVVVYSSASSLSPETAIFSDLGNLLKELQFAAKKNLRLELVNPIRDRNEARELVSEYHFDANANVLILSYDGRTKVVPILEMADFDLTPVAAGNPPRLQAFRGESVFTAALLGLLDPQARKLYFVQGHGEPAIAPGSAISLFLDYLSRQNITAAPLDLSSNPTVPKDAAAIAVVAPEFDLPPAEAKALLDYWKTSGRLLFLLNPIVKTPNLDALSASAGIEPQDDRVLRTTLMPGSSTIGVVPDVAGEFVRDSEITKRLEGVFAYFPRYSQSLKLSPETASKEALQLRPLIEAQEAYWGERDYDYTPAQGVRYDDGRDAGYPVTLAASSERGGIKDDRVEIQAAKMVVIGNSNFALDDSLSGQNAPRVANLDFLVSGVNWLMDRSRMTGIVPKDASQFRLSLTDAQIRQIALFTLLIIPGSAGLLGLLIWLRRR